MNIEEAKQIYAEHLIQIMKKSRDGDRTVKALRIIEQYLQEEKLNEPDLWISTKSDLLIVANDRQLRIYQKRN